MFKNIILVLLLAITFVVSGNDSIREKLEKSDRPIKITILLELAAKEASTSPQSARAYALDALDQAKKGGSQSQQLRALELIVEISYNLLDLEAVSQYGYEGVVLSYDLKNSSKAAYFYNLIGAACDDKEDYDNSLRNYFLALSANRDAKNLKGEARSLHNIALAYRQTGRYDNALHYFGQSISIKEKLKDFKSAANSYNSLGNVYFQTGVYDKSAEIFHKALKLFKQEKDSAGIADALGNLGMLSLATDSLTTAENYYRQALDIDKMMENLPGIASTANNLGLVYLKKKQYAEAEEAFNISLAAEKKRERANGQAEVLNNMAQLNLVQSNKEMAEKLILQAISLSNQADPLTAQQIYSTAGMVYLLKGNYRLGKDMLDKYAALKDSLFSNKMAKNMAIARVKYENAEKEKQQFAMIRDQEINRLENQVNRYRLLFWSLIFSLAAAVAIVGFFHLKRKIK